MITEVVLVDEQDQPLGRMEKMEAHQQGKLHRAFSIFIFNRKGEMLLQQRARGKYHSGGLWSNACCGHPLPGEETANAAKRRLKEELGFETGIEKIFDLTYKTDFNNGLKEHEFDHVFAGYYDGGVNFDPAEVMAISYQSLEEISHSLRSAPELYSVWFRLIFPRIMSWSSDKISITIPKT
ncbi:MAG TPA: isopentenyl-diphosphate Delta-isomerase [Chitinophagaceae bacterium]|nr:isopentenyl-diphosphate Delta-isomerase [Chitinophagaceae bacterium]